MATSASRRYRWRADLREYTAAALRTSGLTNQADEADGAAQIEREYADLLDALAEAKGDGDSYGAAGDRDELRGIKTKVHEYRKFFRSEGTTIEVVDNFEEPSDDDLIELGY